MNLQSQFYKDLSNDKIKINFNKNPIRMDLFLSFLLVNTVKVDCLGGWNGWTERVNNQHNLIIEGGIMGDHEYLESIRYGTKLQNRYNNWVNPFYLFDIMTDKGKKFFIEYYQEEINEIIEKQINKMDIAKAEYEKQSLLLEKVQNEEIFLMSILQTK